MNPDHCNAPHPQIASFFCSAPRDHADDHTFQPEHDKRVFWRNWEGRVGPDGPPTVDLDDDDEDDDGFCISCGDTFRYDDCGGYNPPCSCGYHCRHCHKAEGDYDDDGHDPGDYDPDAPDLDEADPQIPGWVP